MRYTETYDTVTAASAENGDTAENGFLDESGRAWPVMTGGTVVGAYTRDDICQKATLPRVVEHIRNGGLTFTGRCFQSVDAYQDIHTGAYITRYLHIDDPRALAAVRRVIDLRKPIV